MNKKKRLSKNPEKHLTNPQNHAFDLEIRHWCLTRHKTKAVPTMKVGTAIIILYIA